MNNILEKLKQADLAYYNSNRPILTDQEYDRLREELRKQEPDHPYLKTVGAPPQNHLEEVELLIHMGSQNHAPTDDEFWFWYNKYNKPELVISDKVDGSSVEIVYEDGILSRVTTRGDGQKGSNITANAKLWDRLPYNISEKDRVIIRAEATLFIGVWEKYFETNTNPRNVGNGIIGRKNTKRHENKHIRAVAFDIIHPHIEFKTQVEKFVMLKQLGFETPNWQEIDNETQIKQLRDWYIQNRDNIDYLIDGMVCTINSVALQEKLGYSDGGKRPKSSVAWKLQTETGISKVIGMTITMGHTGAIVPAAQVEPVKIGGATVQNVLLNNFDYIKDLNINIGDSVLIEKAGDIIPHVVKIIKKFSDGPYPAPTHCPFCLCTLTREQTLSGESKNLICVNKGCLEFKFQTIRNWISKTGIKYIGDNTLREMINSHVVKGIGDLYEFKIENIQNLRIGNGILGEKMAKKIIDEINKTKQLPIDIFMGSISIKFLGRSMAKKIGYDTPQEYLDTTIEDLTSKEGMGINKAREMKESILEQRKLIEDIQKVVKILPLKTKCEGKLSAKAFVFTGIRMKPDEKIKLSELGGVEKGSISKNIDYLVTKDLESTSSKITKARGLGIKIMSIEEFRRLIHE